ncbi:MAG: hypothetical protein ACYTGE_17345 [Planctomycetota bacterium]|jgi:hypothetical protein
MNWINARLTAAGDFCLAPFASWPPLVVLIAVSVVAGVGMTVVFRYTSNQRALRAVARRTKAQLMCLRIFKDDLGVAIRCQGSLIKAIGLRLWHSLPPMLVLIVPFVFILTQLALRYENRPLMPGESVIAALQLTPAGWSERDTIRLEAPPGVTVETPALRDDTRQAVYWRLRLDEPTAQPLSFRVGVSEAQKSVIGTEKSDRLCTVSARRPGSGFWDRLLRPGEPGFGAGEPVKGIELRYPARTTPIFGFDVPWWVSFIVLSMVTALLVRPFLKVQF